MNNPHRHQKRTHGPLRSGKVPLTSPAHVVHQPYQAPTPPKAKPPKTEKMKGKEKEIGPARPDDHPLPITSSSGDVTVNLPSYPEGVQVGDPLLSSGQYPGTNIAGVPHNRPTSSGSSNVRPRPKQKGQGDVRVQTTYHAKPTARPTNLDDYAPITTGASMGMAAGSAAAPVLGPAAPLVTSIAGGTIGGIAFTKNQIDRNAIAKEQAQALDKDVMANVNADLLDRASQHKTDQELEAIADSQGYMARQAYYAVSEHRRPGESIRQTMARLKAKSPENWKLGKYEQSIIDIDHWEQRKAGKNPKLPDLEPTKKPLDFIMPFHENLPQFAPPSTPTNGQYPGTITEAHPASWPPVPGPPPPPLPTPTQPKPPRPTGPSIGNGGKDPDPDSAPPPKPDPQGADEDKSPTIPPIPEIPVKPEEEEDEDEDEKEDEKECPPPPPCPPCPVLSPLVEEQKPATPGAPPPPQPAAPGGAPASSPSPAPVGMGGANPLINYSQISNVASSILSPMAIDNKPSSSVLRSGFDIDKISGEADSDLLLDRAKSDIRLKTIAQKSNQEAGTKTKKQKLALGEGETKNNWRFNGPYDSPAGITDPAYLKIEKAVSKKEGELLKNGYTGLHKSLWKRTHTAKGTPMQQQQYYSYNHPKQMWKKLSVAEKNRWENKRSEYLKSGEEMPSEIEAKKAKTLAEVMNKKRKRVEDCGCGGGRMIDAKKGIHKQL
jgi:hypothetical protein